MPTATMTSKGQITIPIEVRRALGLHSGSRVAFNPTEGGSYELVPETRTIRALKGAVTAPVPAVDLDRMDEAVGAGAVESLGR